VISVTRPCPWETSWVRTLGADRAPLIPLASPVYLGRSSKHWRKPPISSPLAHARPGGRSFQASLDLHLRQPAVGEGEQSRRSLEDISAGKKCRTSSRSGAGSLQIDAASKYDKRAMKKTKRVQRWSVLVLIIATTVLMGWSVSRPMPRPLPALPPGIALAQLSEAPRLSEPEDGSDFINPLRFPARPPAKRIVPSSKLQVQSSETEAPAHRTAPGHPRTRHPSRTEGLAHRLAVGADRVHRHSSQYSDGQLARHRRTLRHQK
jgi:hypothetical protein